jgi:hypothetical protein
LHRLQPAIGQRQHHVGAQRLDELCGVRPVHHRDHLGAQRLCDLDSGRADAARRPQNQHRLAGTERAALGQCEIHRLVIAQQRDGLGVVEVIRSAPNILRRRHHSFRPSTEHGQRRDPLARLELGLVGRRPHDARDLHAGDERRLEPKLILAAQEQQVREADTRGADVHNHRILIDDIRRAFYIGVDQS